MKMNLKRIAAGAAIAGALGLPAVALGVGIDTASADPGQCWGPNCNGNPGPGGYGDRDQWRPDQFRPDERGPDQRAWDQRRIEDARWDHQPFNWQGQRVEPYWDQDRGAWGFWFLGAWIPL